MKRAVFSLFTVLVLSVLLVLCSGPRVKALASAQPTPTPSVVHHEGRLVLWGNQKIVVDGEGSIFYQKGDMELHGNAQLIVRNGGLFVFEQDYHEQYGINLYDQSQIIVENGEMRSPNRYGVSLEGRNKVILEHAKVALEQSNFSDAGAIWITHGTGAVFNAKDSHIDMLYLAYPWRGPSYVRQPDLVVVEGGRIEQLSPDFDGRAVVTLSGWKQGQVMEIHLSSQDTHLPYDLTLKNVQVSKIVAWSRGNAKVFVENSHLSQYRPDGQSQVVIQNSKIDELVPSFDRLKGEVVIKGWHPGKIDSWNIDLKAQGGFSLSISDSYIGGFVVRPFHVRILLEECDIENLRPFWDAYVVVKRSHINSLWYWDYWGTTVFQDVVVDDLEDIRRYPDDPKVDFWLKGTVTFKRATLVIQGLGEQWLGTVVHREYPVRVIKNGKPVPSVPLRLLDFSGNIAWEGATDDKGEATFVASFSKETRRSAVTLLVKKGEEWVRIPVYLYSSTPIQVDISPLASTPTPTTFTGTGAGVSEISSIPLEGALIRADGMSDDWPEIGPFKTDPEEPGIADDITTFYALEDTKYLYLRLDGRFSSSPPAQFTFDMWLKPFSGESRRIQVSTETSAPTTLHVIPLNSKGQPTFDKQVMYAGCAFSTTTYEAVIPWKILGGHPKELVIRPYVVGQGHIIEDLSQVDIAYFLTPTVSSAFVLTPTPMPRSTSTFVAVFTPTVTPFSTPVPVNQSALPRWWYIGLFLVIAIIGGWYWLRNKYV